VVDRRHNNQCFEARPGFHVELLSEVYGNENRPLDEFEEAQDMCDIEMEDIDDTLMS
jgi:hypothetical protein